MKLAGKVALVTGGASGMGTAQARLFAREGAVVAVADMLADKGRQLVDEIVRAGGNAFFGSLDVTNDAAWREVVAEVSRSAGRSIFW